MNRISNIQRFSPWYHQSKNTINFMIFLIFLKIYYLFWFEFESESQPRSLSMKKSTLALSVTSVLVRVTERLSCIPSSRIWWFFDRIWNFHECSRPAFSQKKFWQHFRNSKQNKSFFPDFLGNYNFVICERGLDDWSSIIWIVLLRSRSGV